MELCASQFQRWGVWLLCTYSHTVSEIRVCMLGRDSTVAHAVPVLLCKCKGNTIYNKTNCMNKKIFNPELKKILNMLGGKNNIIKLA
ncbi:hypothetical protein SK128_011734 [Halocaridina rubra]|uniref:Uncharacterized protein n=1 Tax=Halocaridina rubra TaxID=373956 RepID=A0AAN9FU60_HALRR